MLVLCCGCGAHLRGQGGEGPSDVSHGLCPACKKQRVHDAFHGKRWNGNRAERSAEPPQISAAEGIAPSG